MVSRWTNCAAIEKLCESKSVAIGWEGRTTTSVDLEFINQHNCTRQHRSIHPAVVPAHCLAPVAVSAPFTPAYPGHLSFNTKPRHFETDACLHVNTAVRETVPSLPNPLYNPTLQTRSLQLYTRSSDAETGETPTSPETRDASHLARPSSTQGYLVVSIPTCPLDACER